MSKLRYRYGNGSPKQRKFAGGHEFAKRQAYTVRPHKFRRYRSIAKAAYRPIEGGSSELRLFELGPRPSTKQVSMWKRVVTDWKKHAKGADPGAYRKRRASRPRKR